MRDFVLDELVGRKYLLGELSAEDQHRVEELAFLEPRSFELLQECENELIDDYISQDLTTNERRRFEKYFLSKPARRSDLRIAMALQTYISQNEAATSLIHNEPVRSDDRGRFSRWFARVLQLPKPVWGTLAVLIFIAALLFGLRLLRNYRSLNPIQANRKITQPEQGPTKESQASVSTPTPVLNQNAGASRRAPQATTPRPELSVLSFVLVPGGAARGDGDITKIPLPARSTLLRFDLPLIEETAYKSYQVELQDEQGNQLRHWMALRSQTGSSGKLVRVVVSSQFLKAHQRYRLVLAAVASNSAPHTLAYYYFATAD